MQKCNICQGAGWVLEPEPYPLHQVGCPNPQCQNGYVSDGETTTNARQSNARMIDMNSLPDQADGAPLFANAQEEGYAHLRNNKPKEVWPPFMGWLSGIAFILLSFTASAQIVPFDLPVNETVESPNIGANAPEPGKVRIEKLRDFNYQFLPVDIYRRYGRFHTLDTITKAEGIRIDTSEAIGQCLVEKSGEMLTIRLSTNPTEIAYKEAVRHIGKANDGFSSLAYQGTGPNRETIIVNPILGFVVIRFMVCPENPKSKEDCDWNIHYFGSVAFKTYLP